MTNYYTLILLLLMPICNSEASTTILDVDFESPHISGNSPSTGTEKNLVSEIEPIGSAIVEASLSELGNALSLRDGAGVIFNINKQFSSYTISFDLTFENFETSSSSLEFFIDTPLIRSMSVESFNTRFHIPLGSGGGSRYAVIDDLIQYSFLHEIDTQSNIWKTSINGTLLHISSIDSHNVEGIRFYSSPDSPSVVMQLDNLVFTGTTVPEPSCVTLSLLSLASFFRRCR